MHRTGPDQVHSGLVFFGGKHPMHSKTLLILLVAGGLALAGCGTTVAVHNIGDTTVSDVRGEQPDATQMQQAIRSAGAALGWQMDEPEPGRLVGRMVQEERMAVVEIPYGDGQYRIDYRDSRNLRHDNGQIHPDYNTWVRNLDDQIRAQLSVLLGEPRQGNAE